MHIDRQAREPLRVGVVGLGTVGKRVARAIQRQPDMMLAGVAVRGPTPALSALACGGLAVFATSAPEPLRTAGFEVTGCLKGLVATLDVVIDCTPRGTAAEHGEIYASSPVRAVFQGGEAAYVAGQDFCATVNYGCAVGRKSLRVPSCNTTGLARIVEAINRVAVIRSLKAVLVRCAADPDKAWKGSPNALRVDCGPSHHGADLNRLWPDLDVVTLAMSAPTNHAHVVQIFLSLENNLDLSQVLQALCARPRILLVRGGSGTTCDARKHWGAPDNPSVTIWEESLCIVGSELTLSAAIHMESIVVPDSIDAARALMGLANEELSVRLTDVALDVCSGRRTLYGGDDDRRL